MKKYKLLKDLPLYPAGTICEIRKQDNSLYVDGSESVVKVRDDSFVEIITNLELQSIREGGKFDEWFEEIEESKVWKPEQVGEQYYYIYITKCGEVRMATYGADFIDFDRIRVGNCFKTKEEAEKTVEKLKALRRLREKGLKFSDWEWDFPNDGILRIEAHCEDLGTLEKDLDLLFKEESEDEN